jgi:hypothetical protein
VRAERTPKLARDLVELLPIRYSKFCEYARSGPSLYRAHLNGVGDRTGARQVERSDPRKPAPATLFGDNPDCLTYVASDDPGVIAKAAKHNTSLLAWIPGKPGLDHLNGLTVLRHKRPLGVRRGVIALNYEPPLAFEKLTRLGYEIIQDGRKPWVRPQADHGQRLRRWLQHKPPLANIMSLTGNHPAVVDGRTLFRARVTHPDDAPRVLVPGHNSRKIGGLVVKGKWAGMPIFTLTLEERKSCWDGCSHWSDCYGNKMNWSRRLQHGAALEERIEKELQVLSREHPPGFVVRLHVLGDFPSVQYVQRWRAWLRKYPALNVFGYTSWPSSTPVGAAVKKLRTEQWERFAVRTSNQGLKRYGANTIHREPEAGTVPEGIVCPAQTDRTECCGTCGLCWQTKRSIAFIAH